MPSTRSLVQGYASFMVVSAAFSLPGDGTTPRCELVYGKHCNPAETVLLGYNALWKLHVGVILVVLVARSSKITIVLKQFVTYSVLLELTGVFLLGTHVLNGAMDNMVHMVTCIAHFGFLVALLLAEDEDSLAATSLDLNGIGWNAKGYLLAVAAYFVLWLFVNTQQPCTDVILDQTDFSLLAQFHWNWWSVGALETVLFLWYTAAYESELQQINVALALAALQPVALAMVYMLKPITTTSIFFMTTTSFSLILIFGILSALQPLQVAGSSVNEKIE
ncbi:expressed unknown protein [Seminavis robusta]|uniref:Uncharacterized protein n=1 Tax=Seminavis robusta TaxID=568900 RepID=A0A9N8DHM9_9STRA|nr:expressed unknown protein [Seminavis robusta]|eukprot:Sro163_g073210.1 n/a (277) ;mRNA; r:50213-51043